MASVVEICNLALMHVRAGSINSMDEQSIQARACRLYFNTLRDQTLEDAPWQFAHKIEPLAPLADVEVFGWHYVYQYPSDCLRINRLVRNWSGANSPTARRDDVRGLNHEVPYRIFNVDGDKVVVANDDKLRADYRGRVVDPNLFSNQFVMALSHLLAANIATPLVGDDRGGKLQADNLTLYEKYVSAAAAADHNEQYQPVADSEYITIRG